MSRYFFRDMKSFEFLSEKIFPQIIDNKVEGQTIRMWVAGCSTGKEAYSIAIALKEIIDDRPIKVQIFATDISEPAIAKARSGIYQQNDVEGLSYERLNEFFTKSGDTYQVNKSIRDMCIFSVHNFLKDPPFSKLDFISCRNVLIYMEGYLQKKALTTFHYSLATEGLLFLGKSETFSNVSDLFTIAYKNEKLFVRKEAPNKMLYISNRYNERQMKSDNIIPSIDITRTDFKKTTDDIVLNKYSVSGVLVNEAMDIVYFRDYTGNYLELSPGKPSLNLFKLAKDGLSFELRNILHKAHSNGTASIRENVSFQMNGKMHQVTLEAIPVQHIIEPHYLILFHEELPLNPSSPETRKKTKTNKTKITDHDIKIQNLEQELSLAREDMRSITEEQEAVNEELQSANEELLSGSEELQSLNEELETSKEELQSTNEELIVVNQEIINWNEQFKYEKLYAEGIVETMRNPLLVLTKDLQVKSANNSYYKTFLTNESETVGKSIYELGNKQWNITALKTLLENILPKKNLMHDFEVTHTFSNIGERSMLLNARELIKYNDAEKLILLEINDITAEKQALNDILKLNESLRISEARYHLLVEEIQDYAVLYLSLKGTIENWNKGAEKIKGYQAEDIVGKNFSIFYTQQEQADGLPERLLKTAIQTGRAFHEGWRVRKDGSLFWGSVIITTVQNKNNDIIGFSKVTHDLTERKESEDILKSQTVELAEKNKELELINVELNSFAYVSSHDLQEPLRKIQAFTTRLLEKETDNLSQNGKDYFRRIQEAAQRMQNLIEDLLAFSRISSHERKFEIINLFEMVKEIKRDYREELVQKKATIEVDQTCQAKVIVFQFRQLLQNLISNSLKFCRPEEDLIINIKCVIEENIELNDENFSPENKYCHITFSDNGIGFEPEYNERIFELFRRLHGKNEYTGTGIGLAIVKRIVENHHGIITAKGELDKGATFDIYIPVD